MEFAINTSWNGEKVDHDPVVVKLSTSGQSDLLVKVEAPYFGDKAPEGPPGQPFAKLWEYEVVELFLLNKQNQYVEVEVSPHGQHLVLLLNGRLNMIKDELPLKYTSTITNNTWTGEAILPLQYLPPNVNQVNAYAIHGSDPQRSFEAFSPAPVGTSGQPDFHNLELFKSIDMSVFSTYKPGAIGDGWKDIIKA